MANCKFCGCPTQNNEEICEHCAKELDDVSVAGTDVKMVPPEAKKLNWGAFWFSWLWAVNHRIYFPLVILTGFRVGTPGPLHFVSQFSVSKNQNYKHYGYDSRRYYNNF